MSSLATMPIGVLPSSRVSITVSKPWAMTALGFTIDSKIFSLGRRLPTSVRFGPKSMPWPFTWWHMKQKVMKKV